jgi:hypothetical protein
MYPLNGHFNVKDEANDMLSIKLKVPFVGQAKILKLCDLY